MKSSNRGFTLIESLLALLVFGLVLSFYLPSLYAELQRRKDAQILTEQYRVFYELSQMTLNGGDVTSYANTFKGALSVANFNCSNKRCQIRFHDGMELLIDLENIE